MDRLCRLAVDEKLDDEQKPRLGCAKRRYCCGFLGIELAVLGVPRSNDFLSLWLKLDEPHEMIEETEETERLELLLGSLDRDPFELWPLLLFSADDVRLLFNLSHQARLDWPLDETILVVGGRSPS